MYIWLTLWYNINRKNEYTLCIRTHAHVYTCNSNKWKEFFTEVYSSGLRERSWKPLGRAIGAGVRISLPPPILWSCISHISQNFANFLRTFYLLARQFINRNGMTDSQFESSVHTKSKKLSALTVITHITKHAHFSSNIQRILKP